MLAYGSSCVTQLFPRFTHMALVFGILKVLKLFSANITKWSNALKQFVAKLPKNCLSVFDHFVGLTLKVLKLAKSSKINMIWNDFYTSRCKSNYYKPTTFHFLLCLFQFFEILKKNI